MSEKGVVLSGEVEAVVLSENQQMKAAVLYGKEDLQIESVAVPSIGDGDVLVRVQAALTCGTDVKVFRRGYHARMIVPPALFGHELAGDIVAMGKDVRGFQVGQRVVAANSAPCLECFYCQARQRKSVRGSAVQQRRLRGIHSHSGAHCRAEYVRNSGPCYLSGRCSG